MCKNELKQKCVDWFYQLVMIIGDDYKVVGSCNQDISLYLIPNGTEDEISYYGKPENSFRVSDHWNWYSNIKKCDKVTEIQCHNISLMHPKKRKEEGKASSPIWASCVGYYCNGKYHTVYGEIYDKKTKTWKWIESDPLNVVNELKRKNIL